MAVYVAYAVWQVIALGETTPTYDIYDSENYPLVFLNSQPFAPDWSRPCHPPQHKQHDHLLLLDTLYNNLVT